MNINNLSPAELRRLFEEKFSSLILEAFPNHKIKIIEPREADRGVAFVVTIEVAGRTLEFLLQYKSHPRPALVPDRKQIPEGSGGERCWIFAAPLVYPRLAEVCWERGWGWFDLAGNCRLAIPGLFYVDRKGNEPIFRHSRPDANLGTPEAARVLRALLKPEHSAVRWTSQRELQEMTKPIVSLGLVNKIVTYLRDEKYLVDGGKDGPRITSPQRLLEAWRDAYRFDRIPRSEWFTLLKSGEIEKALRAVNVGHETRVAWAAFSAAEREAPMVHQPKFWLMAADDHTEMVREALQLTSVGKGANLTLLIAPDSGYLAGAKEEDQAGPCTDPLQTYLDTWHAGGRGQEAAQAVLERRIIPSWDKLMVP